MALIWVANDVTQTGSVIAVVWVGGRHRFALEQTCPRYGSRIGAKAMQENVMTSFCVPRL